MTHSTFWKEKNAKQEFYMEQNYPSKDEGEMKISPEKQKLRTFVSSRDPQEKALQVEIQGQQTGTQST